MSSCAKCGYLLRYDSSFCSGCGTATNIDSGSGAESVSQGLKQEEVAKIYIYKNGQSQGPYTINQIKSWVSSGHLQMDDPIWDGGASNWMPLSSLPGIGELRSSSPLNQANRAPFAVPASPILFSGLPLYYQEEFGKIAASNETYKGKWNWAAFFFTGIWALTKGVWMAPLVWMLIFFGVVLVSCGIGYVFAPAIWIIFGLRGNYMYYCASQKNQQILM